MRALGKLIFRLVDDGQADIVRDTRLYCLGCRKRSCAHLSCMEGISVDMVHEAALHLLRRATSGERS
jgi:hypothetical protein